MFFQGTIRIVKLIALLSVTNAWIPSNHVQFKCILHGGNFPKCSSSQLFEAPPEDGDDTGWDEPMPISKETFQERSSIAPGSNGPERDLFIPIVAIVAILGLFGSYGYEMMRLASRGELYLPWSN